MHLTPHTISRRAPMTNEASTTPISVYYIQDQHAGVHDNPILDTVIFVILSQIGLLSYTLSNLNRNSLTTKVQKQNYLKKSKKCLDAAMIG